MNEQEVILVAGLDSAMARVQRMAAQNAPLGARVNAEQEYALAYQKLVRAGIRPQIRRKYRST